MVELARTLIGFAIVLGVLVFVHEMGHYLAARWAGIKVEAFSIGFGSKIWARTDSHGTEWRVCALPLGGYVKMHGMEQPDDVPENERAGWIPGKTFQGKSVAARAVVVAAGPGANFVLAIVLFAGLFVAMGRPYVDASVIGVVPGKPAAIAGIKTDDVIAAIDGHRIAKFEDLHGIVLASAGKQLMFTVLRQGQVLNLPVTPVDNHGAVQIGLQFGNQKFEQLLPVQALAASVTETWGVVTSELAGVGKMLVGVEPASDLSGTIGIAQMSGQALQQGVPTLIDFMALISVSLGLINLFPIPALDGGHLLFFALDAVRGKPLPVRVYAIALYAGLFLIGALVLIGVRNDLGRLGVFQWLAQHL